MEKQINKYFWIKSRLKKYWSIITFRGKISADDLYFRMCLLDKLVFRTRFEFFMFYHGYQVSIGENVAIGHDAFIFCHANQDCGPCEEQREGSITIGSNVAIGGRFHADCYHDVLIGDDCLFGEDVLILTSNHGMNPEIPGGYVKQPFTIGKVVVEDGCWIGARVAILPGVTIGRKCIIGTNSVVTKSIPPYSIAGGIPARVIKRWDFDMHKWKNV